MTEACRDLTALVHLLRERADVPFFAVGAERLGNREFAGRVQGVATGLRDAGFAPGDRLAVHLHRCADEAVALLAAAVAGGIAVPVHPKLKDDQVAHVLADCEPWAVVTSATKGALLADPGRVLGGRRLYAVGAAPREVSAAPFESLRAVARELPPPEPDAPAILLYTSGSTGLAKGVVQSHANLTLGAAVVAGYLRLGPADHLLGLLPLSFDYGLNQLLSALHTGCRITAADFLGAGELKELLRAVRPTGLAGVPSLWHEVARGLGQGTLDAACGQSLRYVTNSGGRLAPACVRALRSAWPHVQVFSMYGLTEAFRSAFLPPGAIDSRPDSFGKAVPGVELLVIDPDSGALCEGPCTGELVHAGAFVAPGYWRQPAATAERFRPDPRGLPGTVVYTGDLVRRDEEGFHYFVGRRDRMLKVAGHRISPDEVAQALNGVDDVRECAVFGVEGGELGHRIVLCAAGDPEDASLPERLLRQCRARLPAYMVPARIAVVGELPRTPHGKVDLERLRREHAPDGGCTGAP